MNKPKPKREIAVISQDDFDEVCYLKVVILTPDAQCWLENNAPEFGTLTTYPNDKKQYSLRIAKRLFNVMEVIEYIEKMGDDNPD